MGRFRQAEIYRRSAFNRKMFKRKGKFLLVQCIFSVTLLLLGFCYQFLSREEANTSGHRKLCDKIEPTWLVLFYVIGIMYMFLAIAIVCDEYFVPTLEFIGEHLELSNDVAGATLMAAGGSAPELFTSAFGTFKDSAIGFGTIVGSATFNVFFVIAVCAIFSEEVLELTWWPLARDSAYYAFGLAMLAVFFGATSRLAITWWEALLLLLFYFGYVMIMKYNQQLHKMVTSKVGDFEEEDSEQMEKSKRSEDLEASSRRRSFVGENFSFSTFRMGLYKVLTKGDISTMDRAGNFIISRIEGDVQKTFTKLDTKNQGYLDRAQLDELFAKIKPKPTKADVDETLKALDKNGDGHIDFEEFKEWYAKSESSMQDQAKILFHRFDTNNNNHIEEDEFAKLLQAMNMGYSEEKIFLTFTKIDENNDNQISEDEFYKWFLHEMYESHVRPSLLLSEAETENGEEDAKCMEEEEEESFSFSPPVKDGVKAMFMWCLLIPLYAAFKVTIPSFEEGESSDDDGPSQSQQTPSGENSNLQDPEEGPKAKATTHTTLKAVAAFIMSIGWLGVFSYFMVSWAEVLGYTAGIPQVVLGLTILAAGTSVPDLISSYIVAKQGFGDMAVSSSIGSNIFDILVGLPLPWLLYCAAYGTKVEVEAENLALSIIILLCMLIAVIISIKICRWRMTKGLGAMMFVFYLIYVFQDLYRADWDDTC